MMLDGDSIVLKNIITFSNELAVDYQDQIQPNGIDLRAATIYRVHGNSLIPREGKAKAEFQVQELELKDGYWKLEARDKALFYVDFFEKVCIPGGFCGIIQTRSSLVRAGIDVVAGIYDAGFQGQAGAVLRIHNDVTVEYGAKMAQMTVLESKFRGKLYTGRYQGSNSQTAVTET